MRVRWSLIARSLDTIGEWWSLLIVREAMLGVRRFSEFQRRLGLARNMLSTRLKRLVESGVMEMVSASDGTSYQEYVLTEKGKSLWPVLNAMRQWGQQYLFQPGEERTELGLRSKSWRPSAREDSRHAPRAVLVRRDR